MKLTSELLLDAISLRIGSDSENHKKIVTDFINLVDESKNGTIGIAESNDAVTQLYLDVLKTIDTDLVDMEDKQTIVSTLAKFESSPVVQKDPSILSTLKELFALDLKLSPKKIDVLASRLAANIDLSIASNFVRRMFKKMIDGENARTGEDKRQYLDQITQDARTMAEVLIDNKNNLEHGTVADKYLECINMSNKEEIRKAVRQYNKRAHHIMRTGLQGLNRMFGKCGGFKLGESITINALKHNYKSGLLMSFAKWIVMHNKPYVDPENPGIPTILFITLENEANENIMWWFESMYVASHGAPAKGLSEDEIVEDVYNFFHDSGYNFIIERKLGPDFGYEEYVQMYERYQKAGHRILVTIIDYMNMMKKTSSSDKSRSDLQLRDLYNKMCNFNKNHMTTQISAHQLNRDAARLVVGSTNVVKKFNDSHYADGMDVGREVDMEIFIHIERNNSGKAFLTMHRGKHRYVNDTPEKDKYCAYQFHEFGIPDDIDGPDASVKNIYAEDADVDDLALSIRSDLGGGPVTVAPGVDDTPTETLPEVKDL